MSFFDKLDNKDKLKNDFLLVTFLVTLYENFKSNWEEEILAFYANSVRQEDGKVIFEFTRLNNNNPKAKEQSDFIKDKEAENRYKNKVYRLVKKENGRDYDREASMFMWLYKQNLIMKEHYEQLLSIRKLRNKLVHELDELINGEFPDNLNSRIKQLIDIRKFSSKQWYINVELSISGDVQFDNNGNIIIPDKVSSSSDIFYDMLYDALF